MHYFKNHFRAINKAAGQRKACRRAALPLLAVLSVTVLQSAVFPERVAHAASYWPAEDVTLSSEEEAAVVMNVDTGTVLYAKNADEKHYPASITKVMTGLLAVTNAEMDETVTFSYDSIYNIEPGSSNISRDVDEQMTMEQTLYGMLLESCNECAYAVAEHVGGGDYDTFIQMMNDKAKELGCKNTHFMNPHGLDDEDHYTTAYDMALIACEAYHQPKFAQICGTRTYQIPPTNKHEVITYLNNNHAMLHNYRTNLYLYEYCVGGKTGYTDIAGNTLVTFAKKDGMTLVSVVMQSHNPAHYVDTTALMDYCFENFTVYNVKDNANLFSDTASKDAGVLSADIDLIHVDEDSIITLPKTVAFSEAEPKIVPVRDEDGTGIVGRIEYTYAGRDVGCADLIYTESTGNGTLPFKNVTVTTEEEAGEASSDEAAAAPSGGETRFGISSIVSGTDYLQIDYKRILLYIGIAALAVVAVILLIKGWNRFLMFKRRRIDPKIRERSPYKRVKHTRRRRRR